MAGTGSLYDHEILLGSTTYRFKLARGENGQPLYQVIPEVLPHASQLKFAQQDWSGGHGRLVLTAPNVYFEGSSIDTTQKNRIILGPAIQACSAQVFLTTVKADNGGAFTTETTASQNTTTNDMTLLPAVPEVNDAYYFNIGSSSGLYISGLVINISTAGVGTWTITWEYYNGSTWAALSNVSDGTNGFTTSGVQTVTWTAVTPSATTVDSVSGRWVRARVSAYTSVTTQPLGAQAWFISETVSATAEMTQGPVYFAWFPVTSTAFCATTNLIFENVSSTVWRQRVAFAGEIISDLKHFDGRLYVGLGSSTQYYYTADGASYTQYSDAASKQASKFLQAPTSAATATTMWRIKDYNILSHSVNPINGGTAWATDIEIGDALSGSDGVTNIFLHNDELLIGRTDGLFQYDADGAAHNLMPHLVNARSTTNFQYVANWLGSSYASFQNTVVEINSSNSVKSIGPLNNISDVGLFGLCRGITADKDWLYVAMRHNAATTNTAIYKGRPDAQTGEWAWCPIVRSTTTSLDAATVIDNGTTRRLWFGQSDSANFVVLTDNPTADTNARFASAGWLRTCYDYGSSLNTDKLWQYQVMETKGCASGITVTTKYRADTDTSSTASTSALTSNGINKTVFSSALACKRIQFELNLATNDSTKTPEVSYFEARGVEKPEVVRVHECVYEVDSDPRNKASTIYGWLRTIAASTSLAKFARLALDESTASGTSYVWVTMQAGYPQEVFLENTKTHQPRMGVKCRWQEVSFTVS